MYSMPEIKEDFPPFNTIELVPLHVIVADQLHSVGENGMGWNGFLSQSDCPDSWWWDFIVLILNMSGQR